MNTLNTLRGALRRIAGSSFPKLPWPHRRPPSALLATSAESARRTVPLPTIFTPGAPTLARAGVMPKPTPANLRRFAEMPIARKAINTIKDRIAGMAWRIQPRRGRSLDESPSRADFAHDGVSWRYLSGDALPVKDLHVDPRTLTFESFARLLEARGR